MRAADIRTLFNSIAAKYDLNNRLLSIGTDTYWRRKAIEQLQDIRPERILDVATGTADLAIASTYCRPHTVVGVDISKQMLELGCLKIRKLRLNSIISFIFGKAEILPFQSDEFDAAITSFGVRNFEDLEQALAEMHRILRKGGKLVVLEFSRPESSPNKQIYAFILRKIFPWIGKSLSRKSTVYSHYLPQTILKVPQGKDFLNILKKVGFSQTAQRELTFGIISIYSGVK